MNADPDAPAPAAPTQTEEVNANTEPEAPAAESSSRDSKQVEETKFPFTAVPVMAPSQESHRQNNQHAGRLMGKHNVAHLRTISNSKVTILVNKMEGSMQLVQKIQQGVVIQQNHSRGQLSEDNQEVGHQVCDPTIQ